MADGDVRAAIEASRRELLDLGLRNPLLNYRPTRARGVQITDELPKEVFRILVSEGKAMTFKAAPEDDALPEDGDADGLIDHLDQPEEADASGGLAARHVDSQLQTPLTSPKLQSRLLKTERAARTFIEEQGINTLFLALGMLRWFEDENSRIERSAPLVLVPLQIERSSVQERFHVEYTGDELEENLSLASKLKLDFGISLPDMPAADDGFDVSGYFDEVEKAVAREGRWSVDRHAISLDFFSFGKFLMYRDLEEERWPENGKLSLHPLIGTLLGEHGSEGAPPSSVADDENVDRHITPSEARHVVDADSSQTVALLDAKSGRSFVIQGPPGTGKSQTITNLIAEALAQGKTVLFVSEKMAALEVVKRRLDSVGLGEACLELHSRKTKKAQVLEELGRTMALGSPRLEGSEDDLAVLEDLRDRLNNYCEAVNEEIEASGITPYDAVGELIRQGEAGADSPRLDFEAMSEWNVSDFNRRQLLVERLQAKLSDMRPPCENAFRGATLTLLLPMDERRIKERISFALDLTRRLRDAGRNLAGALRLPSPATREDCEALTASAGWVESAPDVSGMNVKAEEWTASRESIDELIAAGLTHSRIVGEHWDTLIPEAWEQKLLETRRFFIANDNRLKRFFSRQYRAERDRLRGLCRDSLPESHEEQLALVDSILEAQRSAKTIEENRTLGERALGLRWKGLSSDWEAVSEVAPWISALRENVERGAIPRELLDCLASGAGGNVPKLREALEAAMEEHERALASVVGELSFEDGQTEKYLEAWDFERQEEVLSGWVDRFDDLREIVGFNKIAYELRESGLSSAVEVGEEWDGVGEGLVDAYRYTWFEGLAEKALRERPALSGFERGGHEQIVEKFRELDALNLERNRARVALAHWEGVPSHEGGGQLAILRRELNKKRRHLPIRQLMKRAGNAVQAIKPVFMMSPISVANFIEPGSVDFDLVVFDEASQVRPVEALGAVARGRQTVVVGDDKQLPPTRFFDSMLEGEPEEDDVNVTGDLESVLGLFLAQGMPQRMLRWHYRSRHESLITVSNHEFYDDRLTIFPSPDRTGENLGLVYHHLPDTVYDRGKSRANAGEAQVAAEAVMRHAKEKPGLTLGVVAFSSAQAQAVEDQLEILRRGDPSCEEFFALHPFEPFFVKSLENVQGDERDVMFLSLGYGRDANGHLAMNFGPLNQDGGERRLNVLITRARMRCEVFTNLLPDDIDLSRTSARGVRSLKTFLKFAKDGHLDIPTASGRGSDSPFEEAVLRSLSDLGYEVDMQVGSAGFFVDLAVKDPGKPGRYLLGVECDGATYHSARSARDRDRLRQEILEGLGWQIHRIWSTDFFKNPDAETRRLVEAIEKAHLHTEEKPSEETGDAAIHAKLGNSLQTPVERVEVEEAPDAGIPHYETAAIDATEYVFDSRELHRLDLDDMAEWVAEVVRVEGPVHFEDIVRRVAEAGGVSRAGRRIREAVESGLRRAVRRGEARRSGDFFWPPDMEEAPLRDRSELPDSSKKPERVAPEEMEKAIEKVVHESFGMPKHEIPSPVLKLLLGFQRATEGSSSVVMERVEVMMKDGKLSEDAADHVFVADKP
ncbi:MAG: DUF3320 domain-containing protein [Rubrobacter sp.]|nr:DUF3320 domain-containing protein [Rubrobacter sp.]